MPPRDSDALHSVHAVIKGRVQGVGYRAWTAHEARTRQLAGWVRNRSDGDVEAVFCGRKADVEDMLAACRLGPDWAGISDIVVNPAATTDSIFTILPTL